MIKGSRGSSLFLFPHINKRNLLLLLVLLLISLTCIYITTGGISASLERRKGLEMWRKGLEMWGKNKIGEEWALTEKLWKVIAAGAPRQSNRCAKSACGKGEEWMGWESNKRKLEAHNYNYDNIHYNANIKAKNHTNVSTNSSYGLELNTVCPDFFEWIKRDLEPWRKSGISREMLDKARDYGASMRLVIKQGKLFVEGIGNCYQTRAVFSLWGLLQLLRYYPGLVPDVEFIIGCGDVPLIPKDLDLSPPPPVLRYCTTHQHYDIPFPDWSFWGWPEVNIQPWEIERRDIEQGASKIKWINRIPKAYWRGNIFMGEGTRVELTKCHRDVAEILSHDWDKEVHNGYKNSKLSSQCRHRYKVYVEGIGWSVSLKYILACDSPTLLVKPKYIDFFTRGLIPRRHFWSMSSSNLCPMIASTVHWGNNHTIEAMELGKTGSEFTRRELSMAHVYDFMLHTLREYAKLQTFEPMVVVDRFDELCVDAFLCVAPPQELALFKASIIHEPSPSIPCFLQSSEKPL